MPTFDFQCRECERTFEFSRPFGSAKKPACPDCGSRKTEKLIAPPAVHFKGSGFYKTDSQSRSTETKPQAAGEDAAPKKPSDGVETKAAETPAGTTEKPLPQKSSKSTGK